MTEKKINAMVELVPQIPYCHKDEMHDKKHMLPAPGASLLATALFAVMLMSCAACSCNASHPFSYAGKPVKADAVVLFLGSESRKKEASRLLEEGYARLLIVPAAGQIFTGGKVPDRFPRAGGHTASTVFGKYPGFYEHTHREVLNAKKTMKAMGLRSAIMVSSPYHMERIRLISRDVFGKQAGLFSYVPSRYEHRPNGVWEHLAYARLEMLEFIKICWFRLYSFFF